jgi:lipopolysaccharide heptosyltransferase I
MNILIVRLGALGDIVHTIPAAAALRTALPEARIDWLVEAKHRSILDLVPVIDRVVALEGRSLKAWADVVRREREVVYDIALDFQGLMKSAVLARASGAARVAGFSVWHLREKGARPFYSETDEAGDDEGEHVIYKNLRLLRVLGVDTSEVTFPLHAVASAARDAIVAGSGRDGFALINPGAAWPNKRWAPSRFGEVAAFVREVRGLSPWVLWGPGEEGLAQEVVEASAGAARVAPPTAIADLVALGRDAALLVSGDTGPLHIAGAVGTPVVGVFGPTDPRRNGPWSANDVTVSRFESCACHYERQCSQPEWCLEGVTVAEVTSAIQRRLGRAVPGGLGRDD